MELRKYLPVDWNNDRVHREGSVVCIVLTPDRTAWKDIILWSIEAVVDTAEYNKEPGDNGQDFVSQHSSRIVAVLPGERVDCE